jgi:hypothetical protein
MSSERTRRQRGPFASHLLLICALGLPGAGVAQAAPTPAPGVPAVDQRADALLKRMNDALLGHRRFSVVIDQASAVGAKTGHTVRFAATSTIVVERPNRLRMDHHGDLIDVALYYDGKSLTFWRRRTNVFANTAAPPTLDQTLEFARERIEIEIPAADLLGSDPVGALKRGAHSIQLAGREAVHGVACQHIVLKGLEMDQELWIEDGESPLPWKVVVVAKTMIGSPTLSAEFRNWSFDSPPAGDTFTFEAPPGAARIPLLEMIETLPRAQVRER